MSDGLRIDIKSIEDIESEFLTRAQEVVWCNAATVDGAGRPRSRILHPIWDRTTGWVGTFANSFKAKHMREKPYMSLGYVANITRPMYIDCHVTWEEDPMQKQKIWDLFASTPEPVGYNPAPIFGSPDDPAFGLLKLKPWRVQLDDIPPGTRKIWRSHSPRKD